MSLDVKRRPMLRKEDQRFSTEDINLPRPRFYFNKPDMSLDVSDICGARKRYEARTLGYSKRCVDPLDPVYILPSFTHLPPPPQRFIRDALDITDIEGTKATIPLYLRMKTRDHINYNDVEGSTAFHRMLDIERKCKNVRQILQVADINNACSAKSNRCTNPLSPRYDYDRERRTELTRFTAAGERPHDVHNKQVVTTPKPFGDIEGSHSKQLRKKSLPMFSLQTYDIDGNETMTSWRRKGKLRLATFVNETGDIPGAQADTAKFEWKRCTNPLMPKYQTLDRGDSELLNAYSTNNIGLVAELQAREKRTANAQREASERAQYAQEDFSDYYESEVASSSSPSVIDDAKATTTTNNARERSREPRAPSVPSQGSDEYLQELQPVRIRKRTQGPSQSSARAFSLRSTGSCSPITSSGSVKASSYRRRSSRAPSESSFVSARSVKSCPSVCSATSRRSRATSVRSIVSKISNGSSCSSQYSKRSRNLRSKRVSEKDARVEIERQSDIALVKALS